MKRILLFLMIFLSMLSNLRLYAQNNVQASYTIQILTQFDDFLKNWNQINDLNAILPRSPSQERLQLDNLIAALNTHLFRGTEAKKKLEKLYEADSLSIILKDCNLSYITQNIKRLLKDLNVPYNKIKFHSDMKKYVDITVTYRLLLPALKPEFNRLLKKDEEINKVVFEDAVHRAWKRNFEQQKLIAKLDLLLNSPEELLDLLGFNIDERNDWCEKFKQITNQFTTRGKLKQEGFDANKIINPVDWWEENRGELSSFINRIEEEKKAVEGLLTAKIDNIKRTFEKHYVDIPQKKIQGKTFIRIYLDPKIQNNSTLFNASMVLMVPIEKGQVSYEQPGNNANYDGNLVYEEIRFGINVDDVMLDYNAILNTRILDINYSVVLRETESAYRLNFNKSQFSKILKNFNVFNSTGTLDYVIKIGNRLEDFNIMLLIKPKLKGETWLKNKLDQHFNNTQSKIKNIFFNARNLVGKSRKDLLEYFNNLQDKLHNEWFKVSELEKTFENIDINVSIIQVRGHFKARLTLNKNTFSEVTYILFSDESMAWQLTQLPFNAKTLSMLKEKITNRFINLCSILEKSTLHKYIKSKSELLNLSINKQKPIIEGKFHIPKLSDNFDDKNFTFDINITDLCLTFNSNFDDVKKYYIEKAETMQIELKQAVNKETKRLANELQDKYNFEKAKINSTFDDFRNTQINLIKNQINNQSYSLGGVNFKWTDIRYKDGIFTGTLMMDNADIQITNIVILNVSLENYDSNIISLNFDKAEIKPAPKKLLSSLLKINESDLKRVDVFFMSKSIDFEVAIDIPCIGNDISIGRFSLQPGKPSFQPKCQDIIKSKINEFIQNNVANNLSSFSFNGLDQIKKITPKIEINNNRINITLDAKFQLPLNLEGEATIKLLPEFEIKVSADLEKFAFDALTKIMPFSLSPEQMNAQIINKAPYGINFEEINLDLPAPLNELSKNIVLKNVSITTAGVQIPESISAQFNACCIPLGFISITNPGILVPLRQGGEVGILGDVVITCETEKILCINSTLSYKIDSGNINLDGQLILFSDLRLMRLLGIVDLIGPDKRVSVQAQTEGMLANVLDVNADAFIQNRSPQFLVHAKLSIFGIGVEGTVITDLENEEFYISGKVDILVGSAETTVYLSSNLDDIKIRLSMNILEITSATIEIDIRKVFVQFSVLGFDLNLYLPSIASLTPDLIWNVIASLLDIDIGSFFESLAKSEININLLNRTQDEDSSSDSNNPDEDTHESDAPMPTNPPGENSDDSNPATSNNNKIPAPSNNNNPISSPPKPTCTPTPTLPYFTCSDYHRPKNIQINEIIKIDKNRLIAIKDTKYKSGVSSQKLAE